MYKRVITLFILLALCFTFVACSDYPVSTAKDKDTGENLLIYQNNRYYLSDSFDGASIEKSDRKLLDGGEYDFGYYYSYTYNKPMYIVSVTDKEECYVREDYSFSTDTFNIIGSEVVFVFNEAVFVSNTVKVEPQDIENTAKEVLLYSKSCPFVVVKSYVFRKDSLWYIYISGSGDKAQELTPEFSNVLFEKGLLY